MAAHQLGRALSDADVAAIVGWLVEDPDWRDPHDYIRKPELPKAGPKTPRPDAS